MNISQNFKAFRESKNLTQKQLADIIGISHQMISQIETGFRPPSAKNILDIALALGCTTVCQDWSPDTDEADQKERCSY